MKAHSFFAPGQKRGAKRWAEAVPKSLKKPNLGSKPISFADGRSRIEEGSREANRLSWAVHPPWRKNNVSDSCPGTKAPDFTLPVTANQKLSLSELRGQSVILAFYPADWSPVCGDQMAFYNEVLPEFQKHKAELMGISVDGVWCHAAFAEARHLHFPLLADFEPKGSVARKYGVYRENDGITERALFVINKDGIITWSYCSPIAVNPGADGILQALEDLSKQKTA